MASTLPLTATAQASGPAPRSGVEPADAAPESSSFADTLQAQETSAAAAEPQASAKSTPTAATSPRARAAATAESDIGADGEGEGAASLDSSKVDALLGLCEPTPAVATVTTVDTVVAPPESPPEAGALALAADLVALPASAAVTPDPALSTAQDPSATLEPDFAALDSLRAMAAAATTGNEAELAARLEATLADGEESVSHRDAASGGASAALFDTRAATPARVPEPQAAAARAPELRAPLGTPGWSDELGSRVTWMVEQGEQVASLRLSPENLGPLDVRIAVREGETTVWFGAVHPETRAALEQSLPRLREMLSASGLALANAGVFSQTPRDPQRGFTAAALARAAAEGGSEGALASVNGVTHRGLVDLYA